MSKKAIILSDRDWKKLKDALKEDEKFFQKLKKKAAEVIVFDAEIEYEGYFVDGNFNIKIPDALEDKFYTYCPITVCLIKRREK